MGINYPGGIDSFSVPTLPEDTPLSEAGSSTRNHPELHEDINSAVEALEGNASFKDHDHSGGGTTAHGNKLLQVNTHQSPDTDIQATSLHHTLGTGGTQAAAGNHRHDYVGDTIYNKPLIVCTSTTRPGSPFIGQMVYETDTNAMRIWASQDQAATITGITGGDTFERTSTTDMGTSLWEQTSTAGPGHGGMAPIDGHNVYYLPSGAISNQHIARRINSADAITASDNQVVTFNVADYDHHGDHYFIGDGSQIANQGPLTTNDVYLRMSSDRQSYYRVSVNYVSNPNGAQEIDIPEAHSGQYVRFCQCAVRVRVTTTGPSGEVDLGTMYFNEERPAVQGVRLNGTRFDGSDGGLSLRTWRFVIQDRSISIYQADQPDQSLQNQGRYRIGVLDNGFLGAIKDTNNLGNIGSSYRGWGIGMGACGVGAQSSPSSISDVTIQDLLSYSSATSWVLLSASAVPSLRLRQVALHDIVTPLNVLMEWDQIDRDTFHFFDQGASATDIAIKESGLYRVHLDFKYPAALSSTNVFAYVQVNGVTVVGGTTDAIIFSGVLQIKAFIDTHVRMGKGDILRVRVVHEALGSNVGSSFYGNPSNLAALGSVLEIQYVTP